ncbi:carboxylate--amine ligase [Marinobacter sp. SS21]|uniref:carboxylate--amine ligase n=1 Tax=Marinobacter sp. SS21 TaxID=2979460 RepID=UPI002330A9A5|nr:hypothetical protein [Marinobacter sp. SS21]MDC0663126.1 hypothetical protein [Marinobacter sp. SS21]
METSVLGMKPPVILLGGLANTTSVARSLGRAGIRLFVVAPESSPVLRSRYIHQRLPIAKGQESVDYYHHLLVESQQLPQGAVVFPCSDCAIDFVARFKASLQQRYVFDIQDPQHQLDLLDKQKTIDLARQAGCQAPGYWPVASLEDVQRLLGQLRYPVLIKPIHSHVFQSRFNKKLFLIENEEQLLEQAQRVLGASIEFMLCEFVPGPDTLLSSYYVYRDQQGRVLFEFTKRVIRRAPPNFGAGAYHITEWLPQTAEAGRQFFQAMAFTGLGNIEFKTDPRDGQLKVIECNARFTGAQELVTRSGVDMPNLIYNFLVFGTHPEQQSFRDNMTLWIPLDDFDSFRELHALGKLTLWSWIRSVLRPHVFCYLSVRDPKPFLFDVWAQLTKRIRGKLKA